MTSPNTFELDPRAIVKNPGTTYNPKGIGENHRIVLGVGPDAPTVTSPKGGKQSAIPYRLDLLPSLAVLDVAQVLKHGADKYGVGNWRGIGVEEIINHVLVHILAWLAGDRSDNHLGHAACRMLMAHELDILERKHTEREGDHNPYDHS